MAPNSRRTRAELAPNSRRTRADPAPTPRRTRAELALVPVDVIVKRSSDLGSADARFLVFSKF